jgi:hypothetical protein
MLFSFPYYINLLPFWMRLAKLGKSTTSFVMSVSPRGTTQFPLDGFSWNMKFIRKSFEKIYIFFKFKSDKNNLWVYFTWIPMSFCGNISLKSSWVEEYFRQICRENQNTCFIFNILFFQKISRLLDNVENYCRAGQATDDNIIRRMRFAFWIDKATETHSEYVILITFPQQRWLR